MLGVVQESKLGPLFYDLYISDFQRICNDSTLYADDRALVFTGNSLGDLTDRVNSKLQEVYEWCNYNKLCLNANESEFILVTNKKVLNIPRLSIGGNFISQANCVKYLGVHIDEKMKFSVQLANLKARLSRICNASYRLRNLFDKETAMKMYYSCVHFLLTYCIAAW